MIKGSKNERRTIRLTEYFWIAGRRGLCPVNLFHERSL